MLRKSGAADEISCPNSPRGPSLNLERDVGSPDAPLLLFKRRGWGMSSENRITKVLFPLSCVASLSKLKWQRRFIARRSTGNVLLLDATHHNERHLRRKAILTRCDPVYVFLNQAKHKNPFVRRNDL